MKPCIVILGQTATGKTQLAVNVATQINAEIISADSRQVYKGMDIGTGKDLSEYLVGGKQVKHYLIDILCAGEKYNVFDFSKDFLNSYQKIVAKNRQPIMVGGSGLYISAVVDGYKFVEVPENKKLRDSLNKLSVSQLVSRLNSYKKLHNKTDTTSKARLVRALEIAIASDSIPQKQISTIDFQLFGIHYPKEILHERIFNRVTERLNSGMVEEVEELIGKGLTNKDLEYYGLEYKFISNYLQGEFTYEQMAGRLFIAIKKFAKRQATWFRRMEKQGFIIHWIDGRISLEEKIKVVKERLKSNV